MHDKDCAVDWVDRNKHRIRGRAMKFARMSPYDTEDFLQDAYEAALLAEQVAARKGLDFERCFWVTYRRVTCGKLNEIMLQEDYEVTDLPSEGDPCFELLVIEELESQGQGSRPEDLVKTILGSMSPKAKEAWEYSLLGYSPKEVGELLGIRRQSVEKRKEQGVKRVRHQGGFNELCKV